MKITEQFVKSKVDDPKKCEDAIFVNEHYIAVIDGVTPKGTIKWGQSTSGHFAKEIIMKALVNLDYTLNADAALRYLNDEISKHYGQNKGFFIDNSEERIQAVIAIYSDYRKEIWRFGNCQFLVNEKPYLCEMKIDTLLAEVRSVYLKSELLKGKSADELVRQDPSWNIVLPIIKNQFSFANKDIEYGFNVLDGICDDFGGLEVIKVSPGDIVVIASDGYPHLYPSLEKSEAYLENLKKTDPLCIEQYKSVIGFTNGKISLDDRSYIKFIV